MGTKVGEVGEVRGDQQAAHNCYAVSTNPIALARQCVQVASEVNPDTSEQCHYDMEEGELPDINIKEQEDEERSWTSGHPTNQLEEIPIRGKDLTKVVKVGGGLNPKVKEDLIKLLREYSDIFARTHEEMPGIPLSLATHMLTIDAIVKLVKRKRRHFNVERNAAVQEEVDKLRKVGFIRESQYPEWIANVVMIDQLIVSTVGNKLLSFMDAFSGYNQSMMHPLDQDKTSFVTGQDLYCYKGSNRKVPGVHGT
ncbi:hypothetical protein QYF36_002452 [Acer negundo]|nr:hypothetical protein QYF36_002452 [Acer negundo]